MMDDDGEATAGDNDENSAIGGDYRLPASLVSAAPRKIGPYEVTRDYGLLTLRLPSNTQFGLTGCLLFSLTMLCILFLGVMTVLRAADTNQIGTDDATQIFAPTKNHFGFLWMVSCIALFITIPVYMSRAYKPALTFTFDRSRDQFAQDNKTVTSLRRIEAVAIRETRDPDNTFLYLLHIVHTDGYEVLIHNAYDEREVMNLANEVGGFLERPVVWRKAVATT